MTLSFVSPYVPCKIFLSATLSRFSLHFVSIHVSNAYSVTIKSLQVKDIVKENAIAPNLYIQIYTCNSPYYYLYNRFIDTVRLPFHNLHAVDMFI